MKKIGLDRVEERLTESAFNSSHSVWAISHFHYYESTTGWIFAVVRKFGVNLIALEPLPPFSPFPKNEMNWDSCQDALYELQQHLPKGPMAFVSIGESFAQFLTHFGFYNLQFGTEPWVELNDFAPRGNKGKGVRAAKNQAVRLGVEIESCSLNRLYHTPHLKAEIEEIRKKFHEKSSVQLRGFLLKTDPWKLRDLRRCFVARNQNGPIEGVLIATPIGKTQSWYFEDLWLTPHTTRGTGELLTLEAMQALADQGAKRVSLGLIPLTTINASLNEKRQGRPSVFLSTCDKIAGALKYFYNADGLILFRKRFNVQSWKSSYLSVKTEKKFWPFSCSLQWAQVLIAIILAHEPQIIWKTLRGKNSAPKQRVVMESESLPEGDRLAI